ncbi:MAG: vanadium-dependent haloperoxidase [Hydrococcus sp. SU_1_0]|nr:vanadium-dependent haloperoxidase [Hydrococcus sp. SU_1_0]
MSILKINDLALKLVAKDFSDGHKPSNGGPTKTSRALAIIHLAAHDAYAKITGELTPRLKNPPNPPEGLGKDEVTGTAALIGAGIFAAEKLYPDFVQFIAGETSSLIVGVNLQAFNYGQQIADAWLNSRNNDGSNLPQLDSDFSQEPGHHRPDPLDPKQQALGRRWGEVQPFVLTDVVNEAPLDPPPNLDSEDYADAFDEVAVCGKSNITGRDFSFRSKAVVGIFWGYDGANLLGTPPRLYNQVVLAIPEFKELSHCKQIKLLTAINVAMADAGIAAWHWKYAYDFWRPVVGIREADLGWGPSALGDGNTLRKKKGDPFWLPLGAPNSNPINKPASNGTPGFPAYPSGHSTFGSACFEVAAKLLGKTPKDINVKFVSDEFNGKTTDNLGTVRPRYVANFTLREAIEENKISRIYLGVHWDFDASGGEIVGKAIAEKVSAAFQQ